MTTAVKVDRDKLAELDSLADLEREIEEAERARAERRERAQDRTIRQAIALIRATPDRLRVRDTDPQTAHDAAIQASQRSASVRARILWTLFELGEMTFDEVAEAIGEPYSTVSTACSDLIDWAFVEPTGETRATRRGGQARVLRCTVGPDTAWRQGDLLEGGHG